MKYDLVIRNGSVVDGSGLAPYRGDVGIVGDRIARIGRINEKGAQEIDAEGHIVTPGFVDGHTHMDAQIFWDELGSCSCWHGVTTAVMGNCGFTLAPSRPGEHDLVLSNLEIAEDIPAEVMAAGIDWSWESYPEYLNAVEARPKAINYVPQVGHSALRTFAMRQRAFTDPASEGDLALMKQTLREALHVGAVGFTTSRHRRHVTLQNQPVASRLASWQELSELVGVLGEEGVGVLQIDPETELTESPDAEVAREFYARLGQLSVSTGVPITYGIRRQHLQVQLDNIDATVNSGGMIFAQCRSEPLSGIFSFKGGMPYDHLPEWKAFRALPLDEQLKGLRDSEMRKRLVDAVQNAQSEPDDQKVSRQIPSFEILQVMREGKPNTSVAAMARERNVGPVELMIDLAAETDLEQVYGRFTAPSEDYDLLAAMKHPHTVMVFSDSGAHVKHHLGPSIYTALFSYWVRDQQAFSLEEAVQMLTLAPALAWGLTDRGLLREGMIADINVFDPEKIALSVPTVETDLPGGAPRVKQKATGYLATVVAGKETFRHNEHTGALPGRLLRGPLARS